MSDHERARGASGAPGRIPAGIAEELAAQGGRVTFARFMELALAHPADGYYSRTERLLGPRGHFSTAPYLSPAFGRAIGRLLEELVDASLQAGVARPIPVVELGAGEGDLGKTVLGEWEVARADLRERMTYVIVEIGSRLRARQRRALAEYVDKGWRVRQAEDIDAAVVGADSAVVLGNEFVDALPVHLVDVRGPRPREAWVEVDLGAGGGPQEVWAPLSPEAEAELRAVAMTVECSALRRLTRDGFIELRPAAGSLLRRLAAAVPAACLLTIDYGSWHGDPEAATSGPWGCAPSEAPVAPRNAPLRGRTVRGYFRHQAVADPYLRVGRQDLTADVDFRALDIHGREVGFETVLFTTVAGLLRADGGEGRLKALLRRAGGLTGGSLEADREATILEALLDEQGLGGAFKVMLQVRE